MHWERVSKNPDIFNLKIFLRIYIRYPYDVHIPLNKGGGVLFAGTERAVITDSVKLPTRGR